jgi:hypothetical protein
MVLEAEELYPGSMTMILRLFSMLILDVVRASDLDTSFASPGLRAPTPHHGAQAKRLFVAKMTLALK